MRILLFAYFADLSPADQSILWFLVIYTLVCGVWFFFNDRMPATLKAKYPEVMKRWIDLGLLVVVSLVLGLGYFLWKH